MEWSSSSMPWFCKKEWRPRVGITCPGPHSQRELPWQQIQKGRGWVRQAGLVRLLCLVFLGESHPLCTTKTETSAPWSCYGDWVQSGQSLFPFLIPRPVLLLLPWGCPIHLCGWSALSEKVRSFTLLFFRTLLYLDPLIIYYKAEQSVYTFLYAKEVEIT